MNSTRLPFTQAIIDVMDATENGSSCRFEVRVRSELLQMGRVLGLGKERHDQVLDLAAALSELRAEEFDVSYAATARVVQVLYELYAVLFPNHLCTPRFDGLADAVAVNALYHDVRPAPTSVVVNDWLPEVLWDKPSSIITFSDGEGCYHLLRPNSHGQSSIQKEPLGFLFGTPDIWGQFHSIRTAVSVAERLYREGWRPATVGARMQAFAGWDSSRLLSSAV